MSRVTSGRSRRKNELDNQEALEEELDHQVKKANLLGRVYMQIMTAKSFSWMLKKPNTRTTKPLNN